MGKNVAITLPMSPLRVICAGENSLSGDQGRSDNIDEF